MTKACARTVDVLQPFLASTVCRPLTDCLSGRERRAKQALWCKKLAPRRRWLRRQSGNQLPLRTAHHESRVTDRDAVFTNRS